MIAPPLFCTTKKSGMKPRLLIYLKKLGTAPRLAAPVDFAAPEGERKKPPEQDTKPPNNATEKVSVAFLSS